MTHQITRIAAAFLALVATASVANPRLPHKDGQVHEGVATCAGSQCHGVSTPKDGANILQNEYYLWSREDRHAQAYKTLLSSASKTIGRRLGIKPEKSEQCLSCHTDYVPQALRGTRFNLSDGVGCEACHGGAENWLESHVEKGATHASNVKAGLYPSEEPAARAEVCLNCHLGGPDHPIDHRIMGAGHPPLGFELDTFTAIEPAHHELDADYAKRKGIRTSLQVWSIGQMASAKRYLDEVASERIKDGAFPELVFFDCYACHHDLYADRWDGETAPGLGVGKVRLHGVALLMVDEILAVTNPGAQKQWDKAVRDLHAASQRSTASLQKAAKAASALVEGLLPTYTDRKYSDAEAWKLMRGIANKARTMPDFNYAEQSNMALEALFLTLSDSGQIKKSAAKKIRAALDKGYDYTNKSSSYSVSGYTRVINDIRSAIPSK